MKSAPGYLRLRRATGKIGSWHWVKLSEQTKTSFWLITGCGKGMYASDSEVGYLAKSSQPRIEQHLCRRCKVSRAAKKKKRP